MKTRNWDSDKLIAYSLFWLCHGHPFQYLEGLLGMERTNLWKRFMKVIHSVLPWAKSQISFPSVSDWISATSDELRTEYPSVLFFFVDGTVLKIWAPSDEKVMCTCFNSKHNHHGLVFFIVVMPNGRILYVSDVHDGSTHDKTHWNSSGVIEILKEAYPVQTEGCTYAVGGDKAYPGLKRPEGWASYVTMTAEEMEDGMLDQHDYFRDVGIARFRAVVEWAIGAVKKWKILENECFLTHVQISELQEMLIVICALTNHQLNAHGGTW